MKYALTSLAVDIDLMKNMSSKFGLNPVNFLTLASFSWECTLKITKIELELLTDVDMILAYKKVISRGITRAICHYPVTDNKHLHDYDETKESTYIQYLVFNNRYGWALSKLLC